MAPLIRLRARCRGLLRARPRSRSRGRHSRHWRRTGRRSVAAGGRTCAAGTAARPPSDRASRAHSPPILRGVTRSMFAGRRAVVRASACIARRASARARGSSEQRTSRAPERAPARWFSQATVARNAWCKTLAWASNPRSAESCALSARSPRTSPRPRTRLVPPAPDDLSASMETAQRAASALARAQRRAPSSGDRRRVRSCAAPRARAWRTPA